MNVGQIRKDFPILKKQVHGQPLIYLDNAATSQKPLQVIDAVKSFYKEFNANIHRGIHDLSQKASERYEKAHDTVAEFINAKGREEIVFVRNTTEAINLVARTYGEELKKGDEILVTVMEHHSNILPWLEVAKRQGVKVKFVNLTRDGTLDYEMLKDKLTKRTQIVAVTHVSNVLGTITKVKKITRWAHDHGAVVLVDGAQSAPHLPVDVKDINCDFFTFSGHKMLGPTGIGALYGKKHLLEDLSPYQIGGGAIEQVKWLPEGETCKVNLKAVPWKFEAGTPNIAGGIGFAEAVKYLEEVGMENVRAHEKTLIRYALDHMTDEVDSITIHGPTDPEIRGGVFSFNLNNSLNYHEVAGVYNEYGIAVRSGFHCAQPLHQYLGSKGSVRASFYLYNTKKEVDRFIEVTKEIAGM